MITFIIIVFELCLQKYPRGFGTQMGEYGDKNYPEFFLRNVS